MILINHDFTVYNVWCSYLVISSKNEALLGDRRVHGHTLGHSTLLHTVHA